MPSLALYLRTLLGAALLCTAPPLLVRLLARCGAQRLQHASSRLWAQGVCRYLDVRLDMTGLERIDRRRTYLVVALHEGFADSLALLRLPLKLRFAARDELFAWRYLGPLLRDTGQLMIRPEHGPASYKALLRQAPLVSASGESLVIFPQGSILGIETQFMTGAFGLARRLRLPILPVVLTGSHRVWEYPYSPRLRYGERISLRVLPPIPVEQVLASDIRTLRDQVQRAMKRVALSTEVAAPRRFVPQRDGYWDDYAYEIDPGFPELAAEIAARRGSR